MCPKKMYFGYCKKCDGELVNSESLIRMAKVTLNNYHEELKIWDLLN